MPCYKSAIDIFDINGNQLGRYIISHSTKYTNYEPFLVKQNIINNLEQSLKNNNPKINPFGDLNLNNYPGASTRYYFDGNIDRYAPFDPTNTNNNNGTPPGPGQTVLSAMNNGTQIVIRVQQGNVEVQDVGGAECYKIPPVINPPNPPQPGNPGDPGNIPDPGNIDACGECGDGKLSQINRSIQINRDYENFKGELIDCAEIEFLSPAPISICNLKFEDIIKYAISGYHNAKKDFNFEKLYHKALKNSSVLLNAGGMKFIGGVANTHNGMGGAASAPGDTWRSDFKYQNNGGRQALVSYAIPGKSAVLKYVLVLDNFTSIDQPPGTLIKDPSGGDNLVPVWRTLASLYPGQDVDIDDKTWYLDKNIILDRLSIDPPGDYWKTQMGGGNTTAKVVDITTTPTLNNVRLRQFYLIASITVGMNISVCNTDIPITLTITTPKAARSANRPSVISFSDAGIFSSDIFKPPTANYLEDKRDFPDLFGRYLDSDYNQYIALDISYPLTSIMYDIGFPSEDWTMTDPQPSTIVVDKNKYKISLPSIIFSRLSTADPANTWRVYPLSMSGDPVRPINCDKYKEWEKQNKNRLNPCRLQYSDTNYKVNIKDSIRRYVEKAFDAAYNIAKEVLTEDTRYARCEPKICPIQNSVIIGGFWYVYSELKDNPISTADRYVRPKCCKYKCPEADKHEGNDGIYYKGSIDTYSCPDPIHNEEDSPPELYRLGSGPCGWNVDNE